MAGAVDMMQKKSSETIGLFLWTIALIATVGSLYFSEVRGYVPCEFCWYQRILMYPLVIVYAVFLWKRKIEITYPAVILSGLGVCLSTYHYLVQKLPALQATGESCGIVPCNLVYAEYFGFITIPFLAGIAFILITIGNIILIRRDEA